MKIKLKNGRIVEPLQITDGEAHYLESMWYKKTKEFEIVDNSPIVCYTVKSNRPSKWSRNNNQTAYRNNLNNLDETNS